MISNPCKNRDSVKFEIIVTGAGWEDYKLYVNGKEIYIITTCIYESYALNDLLEVLCRFSPSYRLFGITSDDYAYVDMCDGIIIEDENTGEMIEVEKPGEEHSPDYYNGFSDEIPKIVNLRWDGEANSFTWTIERDLLSGNEFGLKVTLKCHYGGGEEEDIQFEISYKEFCKAIADGCTKAIKDTGLGGLARSNWGHDITLRYLLFIKAVAYDKLEDIKIDTLDIKNDIFKSSIEKELSLLMI